MAQNETKAEHQLNPVGQSNKQEHLVPNITKNSVESDIRPTGVQLKKEKVQVGKGQEKAQSEKDSHSKNRGGKKTKLTIRYLYHETYRKPNGYQA